MLPTISEYALISGALLFRLMGSLQSPLPSLRALPVVPLGVVSRSPLPPPAPLGPGSLGASKHPICRRPLRDLATGGVDYTMI